jgi:hypothetical protein
MEVFSVGKWYGLLMTMFMLIGCGQGGTPTTDGSGAAAKQPWSVSADQVRAVTISGPLAPGETIAQPLYADRDGDNVQQIVDWLAKAEQVDEKGLQMPKRSPGLQVLMKDGKKVSVEYAWNCTGSHDDKSGSTTTSCSAVADRATIWLPDNSTVFVKSKELYDFLQHPRKDWMPDVPAFSHPQDLHVGQTFTLEGNGWLSDTVTLSLIKDNTLTVWKAEVTPDHGHFKIDGQVPADAAPGNYSFDYRSKEMGSRGVYLEVKP